MEAYLEKEAYLEMEAYLEKEAYLCSKGSKPSQRLLT